MASYALQTPLTTPLLYTTLFGTGAFIMRAAGCTINDMWDKNLDKGVGTSSLLHSVLFVIAHVGCRKNTGQTSSQRGSDLYSSYCIPWCSTILRFGCAIAVKLVQVTQLVLTSAPKTHANVFLTNSILLGTVSLLPVVVYPLMKRITYWPQAVLGTSIILIHLASVLMSAPYV